MVFRPNAREHEMPLVLDILILWYPYQWTEFCLESNALSTNSRASFESIFESAKKQFCETFFQYEFSSHLSVVRQINGCIGECVYFNEHCYNPEKTWISETTKNSVFSRINVEVGCLPDHNWQRIEENPGRRIDECHDRELDCVSEHSQWEY